MDTELYSQDLDQLVDYLIDAIGSGRVGFDDAVHEFVEGNPGKIGSALKGYVQALSAFGKDPQQESKRMDTRRIELRAFAANLNTPQAIALAEALITSQDKKISLLKTLEGLKNS
jgi:hypothetical protein